MKTGHLWSGFRRGRACLGAACLGVAGLCLLLTGGARGNVAPGPPPGKAGPPRHREFDPADLVKKPTVREKEVPTEEGIILAQNSRYLLRGPTTFRVARTSTGVALGPFRRDPLDREGQLDDEEADRAIRRDVLGQTYLALVERATGRKVYEYALTAGREAAPRNSPLYSWNSPPDAVALAEDNTLYILRRSGAREIRVTAYNGPEGYHIGLLRAGGNFTARDIGDPQAVLFLLTGRKPRDESLPSLLGVGPGPIQGLFAPYLLGDGASLKPDEASLKLIEAILSLDLGQQINEPELQRKNWELFQEGVLKLLNRVSKRLATEKEPKSLYVVDLFRNRRLPAQVVEQIRKARALGLPLVETERDKPRMTPDLAEAIRTLNLMLLDMALGNVVRTASSKWVASIAVSGNDIRSARVQAYHCLPHRLESDNSLSFLVDDGGDPERDWPGQRYLIQEGGQLQRVYKESIAPLEPDEIFAYAPRWVTIEAGTGKVRREAPLN